MHTINYNTYILFQRPGTLEAPKAWGFFVNFNDAEEQSARRSVSSRAKRGLRSQWDFNRFGAPCWQDIRKSRQSSIYSIRNRVDTLPAWGNREHMHNAGPREQIAGQRRKPKKDSQDVYEDKWATGRGTFCVRVTTDMWNCAGVEERGSNRFGSVSLSCRRALIGISRIISSRNRKYM